MPITPAVLRWAIGESGYTLEQLAEKIGAPVGSVQAWQRGSERPSLTQFRKLAGALKRTPATFLLPAVPDVRPLPVRFRHPPDAERTEANPEERRYLREAARLQEVARWMLPQLGESPAALPAVSPDLLAEKVAAQQRRRTLAPLKVRSDWPTHAAAFRGWRAILEASGILVVLFPMGKASARGFSLWNEDAPLVAVNTASNHAARIFTLLHEYGHLLTRSSSLCMDRTTPRLSKPSDPAERWCEEFAAAFLLPWEPVAALLRERFGWQPGQRVEDLDVPRAIANAFKVSWRAATIRLIEREAATWELYARIPPYVDQKRGGGGSEGGRDRGEIRADQYGHRALSLFFRALDRRVLSVGDVIDYLDVPDTALDRLQRTIAHAH